MLTKGRFQITVLGQGGWIAKEVSDLVYNLNLLGKSLLGGLDFDSQAVHCSFGFKPVFCFL